MFNRRTNYFKQFEQDFTKNYNFSQQLHFLYLLTFIYINIMISKICL